MDAALGAGGHSLRSIAHTFATGRPRIGVIGHAGSGAAMLLADYVVNAVKASRDQDHLPLLVEHLPAGPDSSGEASGHTYDHESQVLASVRRLRACGSSYVVLASNRDHIHAARIREELAQQAGSVQFVSLIEVGLGRLRQRLPHARRVGLLANTATLRHQIYSSFLERSGLELVLPEDSQQNRVMAGLDPETQVGNLSYARESLLAAASHLAERGVDAIILGSSEIPLVLKEEAVVSPGGRSVPLFNPLAALAEALAELSSLALAERDRATIPHQEAVSHVSPRPSCLGVMGGMGPAASVQFGRLLIEQIKRAGVDTEYFPLIIDQATQVPDRTSAILGKGGDPLPEMLASLRRLNRCGAQHWVMTCNTAHYFSDDLEKVVRSEMPGMRLLHIVDATMEHLKLLAPHARKIGLLATTGTVDAQIYQRRAQEYEWVVPNDSVQRDDVMSGIYQGVKAGALASGREKLLRAAQALVEGGAEAILLACTEIPLVLKAGDVKTAAGQSVPLIDTLEALALGAFKKATSS